jgi:hypothetical protein
MNQRCLNACFIHLVQRIVMRVAGNLAMVWIRRQTGFAKCGSGNQQSALDAPYNVPLLARLVT